MPSLNEERKAITGLELNFSSSGSSHSATITTVLNAKDLSDNESELGSLIGHGAGRTTFSNPTIGKLLQNFIEVERTVSQDGNKKSISIKYEDITSLKLKSHCFVVRGRDSHPQDKGFSAGLNASSSRFTRRNLDNSGNNLTNLGSSNPINQINSSGAGEYAFMPYFSELPNSPIKNPDQRFPLRQPRKTGAAIIIGNVYNEESSVTSDGDKTSLVYQDGELIEEFSYNEEKISLHYKKNPDLASYNIKVGYTLSEAKKGFASAGIAIVGLPESSGNKVLFDVSGSLDSVLSAIASKYGYYWFVDPFQAGVIRFVNSSAASQLIVTNPLKQSGSIQSKYLNASFTENFLTPKIVNAFSSTIEKQKQTFEFGDGQRYTRFERFDPSKILSQTKIDSSIFEAFYGLFLSGQLMSSDIFDVIAIVITQKLKDKIKWGESWEDSSVIKEQELLGFSKVVPASQDRKKMKESFKQSGSALNLEDAKYILLKKRLKKVNRPSGLELNGIVQDAMSVLFNSIYTSKRIGRFKAKRMQWGSSPMNISGPHILTTGKVAKIKEVDQLQSLDNLLQRMGKPDLLLNELFDETGNGEYGFVGTVTGNQKQMSDAEKSDIDYSKISSDSYAFIQNPTSQKMFLAIKEDLIDEISRLVSASIRIFKEALEAKSESTIKSMKAYYTRSKKPTDEPETEETKKEEEARTNRIAGLTAIQQSLDEVGERFDIKYFSLKTNGASGDPTSPVNLDVKNGKISDILALENSNSYSRQPRSSQSSSRTIVGLSLPTSFKITLSSVSVSLSGSGVTTTINESTKNLLPLDDSLIIDSNSKATVSKNFYGRLKANQKNFLGL